MFPFSSEFDRLQWAIPPFCFVSSETKPICFDFAVNYLHSEVEWPIKTEFVIENLNIYEM